MRAAQRYQQVVISGLAHVDAPHVVTSTDVEAPLARTMERLGVQPGLLETLSGILERRVYDAGTQPSTVAAAAGEQALAASGVARSDVGALINTSVCRDHLEPSTASLAHGLMELPTEALNFDVGNACLGFLNGMNVVANMIESGEIEHGLVVDGETSRFTMEATVERLARDDCDEQMFREQFATLTLGSGAVAMMLSRGDAADRRPRFLGGLSRASTAHANLCTGNISEMKTDTKGLLLAGLELATHVWKDALTSFEWEPGSIDTYVVHQVSKVHTRAVCDTLGLDIDRFPLIYPHYGNIGPAGVPTVLSKAVADGTVTPGSRVMLLGVGSGINAAASEIQW
ncbi:MAG TPA: 3-oxoacyl-ACP synthase III [Mycobacteriales bacterium]|jgi:3-oxoacyl-[acyl-carrier-protein] synthase-3|nr:3-oxoacyl-ACP synthase III [Mycobacteriales bacterium]